ncbi:MAG: hypothetical protein ACRC5M_02270 [Anaeroplasmataceae bacterium]
MKISQSSCIVIIIKFEKTGLDSFIIIDKKNNGNIIKIRKGDLNKVENKKVISVISTK